MRKIFVYKPRMSISILMETLRIKIDRADLFRDPERLINSGIIKRVRLILGSAEDTEFVEAKLAERGIPYYVPENGNPIDKGDYEINLRKIDLTGGR